jgi:hypothetical protein
MAMLAATDIQLLQVTLQALASFAIAAGLIFAAVQLRQARRAQHVANFAKLVEMQNALRRMRIDDPALAMIYKHDVGDMQTAEEIRSYFLNLMQLSLFEIAWYAHKHGQLDEDYYQSWLKRMAAIEQEESFKKMFYAPSMKILHDEFQELMEGLMQGRGRGEGGGAGR